jgi:hypothetical protein
VYGYGYGYGYVCMGMCMGMGMGMNWLLDYLVYFLDSGPPRRRPESRKYTK